MLSSWLIENIFPVLSLIVVSITVGFGIYYKFKSNLESVQEIKASLNHFSRQINKSVQSIDTTFQDHRTQSLVTNQRLESMITAVKDDMQSHKHDCEVHKNQLHKDLGQIYERLNK